ncbi:MAG: hypothetical protein SAJ12_08195 [Jaaginema sp. PMC 1079.18]|nr:hypothetical protein [Jaaginema sp. PMC 1080.18]MEC4850979.1 hypothetical protein [Jaaginema sp. PMC 1079.18]MEC4865818.1 hypothetical protein [Jaaginema sp. PMC 1078.18]
MLKSIRSVSAIAAIATVSSVGVSSAIAQIYVTPYATPFELVAPQYIPDVFDDDLSGWSGNAYDRNRLYSPLQSWVGLPSYPEIGIARDAKNINELYRNLMWEQVASGPILRTPDLPNPFNESLLTTPAYLGVSPALPGSEFIFEVEPLR